jgi:3-hydroxymyristoyl/3-hydroxydecanoyl-(acyl carrier protein) dehydratase
MTVPPGPGQESGQESGQEPGEGMRERARFTVPATHPCLPGHFPGEPVVPGVVLLEQVLHALGLPGGQPRELAWVKFQRPLLPGQEAVVLARASGSQWRFEVRHGEALLASGVVAASTAGAPAVGAAVRAGA